MLEGVRNVQTEHKQRHSIGPGDQTTCSVGYMAGNG